MGMLEFCKTRKLIVFVFTALVLIVLVFIFENSILIDEHDLYRSPEKIRREQSDTDLHCWQKEDFKILESCKLCSEFEKEASNINNCTEASSYYEKVNCTNSGIAFRPCGDLNYEIRRYVLFAILCHGLSVLFLVMVRYRSAALDREKQLRIRKQFEMETSYSTSEKKAKLSVLRQLSRQEWKNSVTWARQVALMFENDLIGVTASGLQLRQLKALLSYGGSSDWPHFRILLKPNFQSALDTQTLLDSTDRGDRKEKKVEQLALMQTVELVDDFFETFSPTTTGIVQSPDLVFSSPLSENVESMRQNNLDNATSMMNISPSGSSSLFSPAVFNNYTTTNSSNNNNNNNGSTGCLVSRSEVERENFSSAQADLQLPTPNTATEQQKSQYFSELVELLQENLCSSNDAVHSGVLYSNRQLVQEVVQHWNREKEKKENIIQHGDVSSTALSLSASHIGPILLGVLDSFFFVMNTEGLIEYISDNVVKYLKFHQSDMLNQPIFKFVSNADRHLFEQLLPDSLAFNLFNFAFPTDVVGFEKKRQSRTFCCRFLIKDSNAISILNDVDNILSHQKPNTSADCTFETMHVSAMSLPYPKEMRADYDFLSLSPSTAVSQPCLVCVVRPADSDSEQGALHIGGSNNVCVQREICAKEQQPLLNFYCSMDSQILQCIVKNCTNPALCALETEAVKYKLIALCCNEDRDLLENNLNTAYEKGFATVDRLRLKNPVAMDQGVVVVSLKSQLLSQNAEAFSLAVNRQWPVVHLECTILQTADVKQSVDMRSVCSLESGTSTRDVETSIASLSSIASSLSSPASVVASNSAAKSVWPSQTNSFLDISLERTQFSEKPSVGDEYNFHTDMQQMSYNFVQPLDKIDDGRKVPQDDFERLLSEVFDTKQAEPLVSRAAEVKNVEQPKPSSEVKSDFIGQHVILRHLLNQDEPASLQQGFNMTAGDGRVLSAATFVGGDMHKMVADRKQLQTDECSRPRGTKKAASLAAANHGGSAAKKRAYKNGSQQQDSWPRMHQQPTRGSYGGRKQANTTRNSLLVKLLEQRSPLTIALPTSIATQAMDRPPPQPLATDGLHMPLTLMTNIVTNQQYPSESYRHGHGVYGSSTSFQPSSYYPVTPDVPKAEPLVHDLTEDSFLQNRYTTTVCQRYYSMSEEKLSLTSPAYGTDILECSPQQQMINPTTPTTAYCASANDTLSANCQHQYASPHRNGYQLSQQTQNLPLYDRRISSTYLQNNNNCNTTNNNSNKNAAIVGKRSAVSDERSADFVDTSCYMPPAYAKAEMPKRFQSGFEIDPTRTTNNLAELDFDRNKFVTVKHQYTAAAAAFSDPRMQSNTELAACQNQPDLKSFFDIG
ncbi:Nuclear receptor coactivator 2 [Trichinella papuae]|uniref:Nuclear receptor coactivator 2 n=1 Tax=Trichinella papuae TaxID=268474 RepID=A0A0V1MPJ8_9BILA|nr:Nuclear receptor coactivator 2 [Trichinella papuae]